MEVKTFTYRGVEVAALQGYEKFQSSYGSPAGVVALRKNIKNNLEIMRTVYNIFQDRVDSENSYSKDLIKLGTKLSHYPYHDKGTVSAALKRMGEAMTEDGQKHKALANSMANDILKNVKTLTKNFESSLKSMDKQYEKATKRLDEMRNTVKGLKKKCFNAVSERKGEESMKKADTEFYSKSMKAEALRIQLEVVINKTVNMLQSMENFRLVELSKVTKQYIHSELECSAATGQLFSSVQPTIDAMSISHDLLEIPATLKVDPQFIEQRLADFPAEDDLAKLESEQRKPLLQQYLTWTQTCIGNEKKTRNDVQKVLSGTEKGEEADIEREAARHQLMISNAMMDYLEACAWKFSSQLSSQPDFRWGKYIVKQKDKHNYPMTTLKLPPSFLVGSMDDDCVCPGIEKRVKTAFNASDSSQLSIKSGETVKIILAWNRVWWLGLLGGRVGEVPAANFA